MSGFLIRPEDGHRLLANGRAQEPVRGTRQEIDHVPVVLLHLPFSKVRWLLTEVEPEDPDIAFGLCDLGVGFPELGSVWLPELVDLRHGHLRVVQDTCFATSKPLSWWVWEASRLSCLADVQNPR